MGDNEQKITPQVYGGIDQTWTLDDIHLTINDPATTISINGTAYGSVSASSDSAHTLVYNYGTYATIVGVSAGVDQVMVYASGGGGYNSRTQYCNAIVAGQPQGWQIEGPTEVDYGSSIQLHLTAESHGNISFSGACADYVTCTTEIIGSQTYIHVHGDQSTDLSDTDPQYLTLVVSASGDASYDSYSEAIDIRVCKIEQGWVFNKSTSTMTVGNTYVFNSAIAIPSEVYPYVIINSDPELTVSLTSSSSISIYAASGGENLAIVIYADGSDNYRAAEHTIYGITVQRLDYDWTLSSYSPTMYPDDTATISLSGNHPSLSTMVIGTTSNISAQVTGSNIEITAGNPTTTSTETLTVTSLQSDWYNARTQTTSFTVSPLLEPEWLMEISKTELIVGETTTLTISEPPPTGSTLSVISNSPSYVTVSPTNDPLVWTLTAVAVTSTNVTIIASTTAAGHYANKTESEYVTVDSTLNHYVRIWNGSSWVTGLPYIYDGTTWSKADAYIHDSTWKITNV